MFIYISVEQVLIQKVNNPNIIIHDPGFHLCHINEVQKNRQGVYHKDNILRNPIERR